MRSRRGHMGSARRPLPRSSAGWRRPARAPPRQIRGRAERSGTDAMFRRGPPRERRARGEDPIQEIRSVAVDQDGGHLPRLQPRPHARKKIPLAGVDLAPRPGPEDHQVGPLPIEVFEEPLPGRHALRLADPDLPLRAEERVAEIVQDADLPSALNISDARIDAGPGKPLVFPVETVPPARRDRPGEQAREEAGGNQCRSPGRPAPRPRARATRGSGR
jgi:hypothetical protein